MENVSRVRAFSSPELPVPLQKPCSPEQPPPDYSLEGIATNVKVLLKLIHDHNEASSKDHDDRRMQRIAGMVTILDDVKLRIQKSQSGKKRLAELRRCNTDLRRGTPPAADRKGPQESVLSSCDEKEWLRKQLNASLAARKSLEIMCSSLGKEKEIIASELARKVHELNETEQLVNDLKAQNETLMAKLQEQKTTTAADQGNIALEERNRALSEQLLKSLDSYRSLKRKYKVARDEKGGIFTAMDVIGMEIAGGLERIRSFRIGNSTSKDIDEEISALELMFERFHENIYHLLRNNNINEFGKERAQINT